MRVKRQGESLHVLWWCNIPQQADKTNIYIYIPVYNRIYQPGVLT